MRHIRVEGSEQMEDGGRRKTDCVLRFTDDNVFIGASIMPGTEGVEVDVPSASASTSNAKGGPGEI